MIDWDNLPILRSPKRAAQDLAERERLAEAKQKRRIRKPSKSHSTNKERSHANRAKAKIAKHKKAKNKKAFAEIRQRARAYWQGETNEHP